MHTISSPCLLMNEKDTIREVVKTMVEGGFDYALLTDNDKRLKGIFTQTQGLRRLEEIVVNDWLDSPVSKVMSSPVKTLPLHLYHTAPEFFKSHGVHHAPVVNHNPETKRDEVVAVITSRMYLDALTNGRQLPSIYELGGKEMTRRTLGVASPDGTLFHLLDKLYEDAEKTDVERIRFANLQSENDLSEACETYDALVLDLEGAPERFWIPTVKFALLHPGLAYLALVLPTEFPHAKRKAIADIERKGILKVFEKPLDLNTLIADVQRFWAQNAESV